MFTVLIAEDDPALQRMMCAFLKMNGFRALGAADGEKALELMENVQPDLIIADIMMPHMDGFELTR